MNDQPLDPTTLHALHAVLTAGDPSTIDQQSWGEMLRLAFETTGDDALHGDLSAEDLLPREWPTSSEEASPPPASGAAGADDVASHDDHGWFDGARGVLDNAEVDDTNVSDDDGGEDLT